MIHRCHNETLPVQLRGKPAFNSSVSETQNPLGTSSSVMTRNSVCSDRSQSINTFKHSAEIRGRCNLTAGADGPATFCSNERMRFLTKQHVVYVKQPVIASKGAS